MSRYQNTNILRNEKGNRYLSFNKYPKIPFKMDDIYIYTNIGERLDILAQKYYNDSSLWWIIAAANTNIPKDSLNIPVGLQIRIPQDKQSILHKLKVINE